MCGGSPLRGWPAAQACPRARQSITGRSTDRDTVLALGAHAFLDFEAGRLKDAGEVDVVFDVIGGDILDRSAALVRAGGTLVTIAQPPTVRPKSGRCSLTRHSLANSYGSCR